MANSFLLKPKFAAGVKLKPKCSIHLVARLIAAKADPDSFCVELVIDMMGVKHISLDMDAVLPLSEIQNVAKSPELWAQLRHHLINLDEEFHDAYLQVAIGALIEHGTCSVAVNAETGVELALTWQGKDFVARCSLKEGAEFLAIDKVMYAV